MKKTNDSIPLRESVVKKDINPSSGLSYRKEIFARYDARKELVLKKHGR